jgi:hypothetical protein
MITNLLFNINVSEMGIFRGDIVVFDPWKGAFLREASSEADNLYCLAGLKNGWPWPGIRISAC